MNRERNARVQMDAASRGLGKPSGLLPRPPSFLKASPAAGGSDGNGDPPARPPLPQGGVCGLPTSKQPVPGTREPAFVPPPPSSQAERTSHQNLQSLKDDLLLVPPGAPWGAAPPTPTQCPIGSSAPNQCPAGSRPPHPDPVPRREQVLGPTLAMPLVTPPWNDNPRTHFTTSPESLERNCHHGQPADKQARSK